MPRIVGTYGRGCYEFCENSISLTIPFQRIDVQTEDAVSYKVSNNVSNKSNGQEVRLNATQHRILEAIRDNPNITRSQLALSLGLSQSGVYKALSHLRNNGFIERVGSRKTGWWKVLK